MFTLKLLVMGLVGLVAGDEGLVLVLPNATAHGAMEHVPLLVCDPDLSECSVSDGENEWSSLMGGLNVSVTDDAVGLRLRGERLALAGAVPGTLGSPPPRRHGFWSTLFGVCPQDRAMAQSLSWLPELGRIEPHAGVIDPAHLTDPRGEDVAALLPLAVQGTVRAYRYPDFELHGKSFVRSFTFKQPGRLAIRAPRHAAPDVLEVSIAVAGDAARIHLEPFAGDVAARTLTIRPRTPGGDATVLLGNLTPMPPMGGEPHEGVGSEVTHFALYYDLSRPSPSLAANGALRVPHVGRRRVKAEKVNPLDLPRVLVMVSRPVDAGGVERPVCTFGGFTRPPAGE